jgi:hypothetical protein
VRHKHAKVLYEATVGFIYGSLYICTTIVERLNDLNRYLLYFPEKKTKQLDQDETIEILDQTKAPE